ncbi:HNH endonuclease [Polyangium jinanense]|uniref:HNH endonuclease n=1 Tax=Polyangium jinanense TaxID=2829994 RepID=UPI00234063FC|nr:HNH endonuclease [Polyangium jinanense]MDC3956245.1 HNH endonuclease [Polyangium jinanense]
MDEKKKPSRTPQRATSSDPEEQNLSSFAKFSALVRQGSGDECWYWLGAVNNRGYGVFRVGRRVVMAHRHMFELEHGRPPSGMVLHTCGKKTCVNPSHLYEGSKPNPFDADAVLLEEIERQALPAASSSRGRPGINNPRARLTEEQVKEICALLDQGVSPRMIGFSFGVDAKSIRNIDEGKTWRHVPEVARRAEAPKKRRRGGWRRRAR